MTGFSDKQIVFMLGVHSLWSKRACKEILRRPGDFIPLLIDILDKTINDPESLGDVNSLIPSALLLAQLREKQAYPLLVNLINYDEESVNYLWGDILTECYVSMLRDTFNGNAPLLNKVIENRSASPWARSMAVYAWGMHYLDGHIERQELVKYFRHIIHETYSGKLDDDDKIVLSHIADTIREQQLEELTDDVQTLYAKNAIDKSLCGSREEYVNDFQNPLYGPDHRHVDDVIHELEGWHWFKEEEPDEDNDYDDDYDDFDDDI